MLNFMPLNDGRSSATSPGPPPLLKRSIASASGASIARYLNIFPIVRFVLHLVKHLVKYFVVQLVQLVRLVRLASVL